MLSLDRQNAYREKYRAAHPEWRPATEVYEALIRQRLTPGACVLDLGCGRGGVLEQLGSLADRPAGLDPDLLSLREHRIADLPRAQALAHQIPLRSQSMDLIVCSWVLEHLPAPETVLAEVARTLKPGGSFIFLTPNAISLAATLNRILRPLQHTLVPKLYGRAEADTFPVQYKANTLAQIQALASGAGLQSEVIRQVPDPTYLAFNAFMYRISGILIRITPAVHLVGMLTKPR